MTSTFSPSTVSCMDGSGCGVTMLSGSICGARDFSLRKAGGAVRLYSSSALAVM